MSHLRKILVIASFAALCVGGTAYAITIEFGNTVISTTATVQPRELPKRGYAPISLTSITRIGTMDHTTPSTLETIEFLVDKHSTIDTKGVPVCTMTKLAGTTPGQARKRCGAALVGTGLGKAVVTMPGRAPFKISSPLSFFNAPPTNGRPTLIAHAYETVPSPQALLVPIVVERVARGRYGYRIRVDIPEIAGGFGAATLAEATIDAVRKRAGKSVGYLNAQCSGGRLQVEGHILMTNGDRFPATLTSPCHFPG
ncbi:MAG TPA: hypothetical protein VFI17_06730 [Solirubrobacterales bacterium]|nr:hypothetical protein [Solirubrobacterales bacterium]